MKIVVQGRLPGINDIVSASRTNRYKANSEKKKAQLLVCHAIGNRKRLSCNKPVVVHLTYYEPNNRRDVDNITGGGNKVILDALVEMGVIVDDSRKWVKQVHPLVYTDAKNPRIEIEIKEEV